MSKFVGSEILNSIIGLALFFPEAEILLEELNDRLGISEGLLVNIVDLLQSFRQCCLTKLTGFLVVIHHFVVEHREVQSQSESNWVASIQLLGKFVGLLIT